MNNVLLQKDLDTEQIAINSELTYKKKLKELLISYGYSLVFSVVTVIIWGILA